MNITFLRAALFAGIVSAFAWLLRSKFKSQFTAHFISGILTHLVIESVRKTGYLEKNLIQSD